MIFVTGDLHGDITRFKSPEMKKLSHGDTLIVAGDFGFLWNNSIAERATLKKLAEKNFRIAFIDGCHENFDILEKYPVETWNGGKIRKIEKNIFHLLRGQVYTIEKKKIFTFGGGHSQDFEFRSADNWWEREQPTYQEIVAAADNLKKHGNKVDYIITHEPPASVKDCLRVDTMQRLEVHAFFEDLITVCEFQEWYFGKCHLNRYIPVKYFAIFDEITPLKDTKKKKRVPKTDAPKEAKKDADA